MPFIGGTLGYWLLRLIGRYRNKIRALITRSNIPEAGGIIAPDTNLKQFLGKNVKDITGKIIIDFGCGQGKQSVGMALMGAKKVIGIDFQPSNHILCFM